MLSWVVCQFGLFPLNQAEAAGSASSDYSFANGNFRSRWERADLPVVQQTVNRSFTWGPQGWAFRLEPYVETAGARRQVQYFDKARMEITHPEGDPNGVVYITNGLLVREMVAGQIQDGDTHFVNYHVSQQAVVGDPGDLLGPTYESFRGIASLYADNRVPKRTGEPVKSFISRTGQVTQTSDYGEQVKYSEYNPELGHNIADVFWEYMNQTGPVYVKGNSLIDPVFNWVTDLGFPITEPYWTSSIVRGQPRGVLVQLFERRVLTYTPSNPDGYKVEMGNVGIQYYQWRYPLENAPVAPWSVVKLTNATDCDKLAINLSGQDNLTIELSLQADRTLKLGPGTYNFQVSGCSYVPFYFSKTYQAGVNYDDRIVPVKPLNSP